MNNKKIRILLAGEQWNTVKFEMHGANHFSVSDYGEGGGFLFDALTKSGKEVTWMKTNFLATDFPLDVKELKKYDVLILSDVSSDTLYVHPQALASVPIPNRMTVISDYVKQGGGLLMIGGWMSFAGKGNGARWHDTKVEEALPVNVFPYDDREEVPEGVYPIIKNKNHPILKGLPSKWPYFMGYNKVTPKKNAEVLISFEKHPLLTVGTFQKGKTAAFASDCAPHWGPTAFLEWEGYGKFWNNLLGWLAK